MTILITGAGKNAFLGYHVTKLIKQHFENVIAVGSEFDLTKELEINELFKITKPSAVLHLAAVCGGIGLNKRKPADLTRKNLLMSANVVHACYEYNVDYLIGLGSVCGYPMHCHVPFKEESYLGDYPELTNAGYGYSKRMLFMLQNSYREQYGLKSVHLIPVNLFGPNDHFDLENSHVIPALINKFVTAVATNQREVKLWGSGEASREFLFVHDLCNAIFNTLKLKPNLDFPINIGTGSDISIKDLASKIANLAGFKGDIVFTGEVSDGQPKRRLDISKASELLNFKAKTSLDDGLRLTIDWYKENCEHAQKK